MSNNHLNRTVGVDEPKRTGADRASGAAMSAPTHTIPAVYSVRMTDHHSGSDHLVDDAALTAGYLGEPYRGLCGAVFEPASPLYPHGPVCDSCAGVHNRLHLRPAERAPELAAGVR